MAQAGYSNRWLARRTLRDIAAPRDV